MDAFLPAFVIIPLIIAFAVFSRWRNNVATSPAYRALDTEDEKPDDEDEDDAHIQTLGQYVLAVVGESHRNADGSRRQDIIRRHGRRGAAVILRREPDNRYDPNAVAVVLADSGQQIGYLSRDNAAWVSEAMRAGRNFSATIADIHGGTPDKPSLGVTISVTKT